MANARSCFGPSQIPDLAISESVPLIGNSGEPSSPVQTLPSLACLSLGKNDCESKSTVAVPGRAAAFSFENHDGPQEAVLLSSERLTIHVVDRLPEGVADSALVVNERTTKAAIATAQTLVFIGDVRVDVGGIAGQDQMLSLLKMHNSTVRGFRVAYGADGVRGPPPAERVAYVVGTMRQVDHPEQREQSYLQAAVVDLDLREGHRLARQFDRRLDHWGLDQREGPRRRPGEPYRREGGEPRYRPPEYRPPEYHPPAFHPEPRPVFP